MKLIAFGASYSSQSINKKFASYVSLLFPEMEAEVLDLNDYTLPVFTVDLESEQGYPDAVHQFIHKMKEADFIIISMAEHNGNFTAGFKNLFDWTSRVEPKIFDHKPILLLSASPGGRGGKSSLEIAQNRFPFHGATILGTFSLPKFYENFSEQEGIINEDLKSAFDETIAKVKTLL